MVGGQLKPRILVASEFSKLSTGYAVNSREILKELHNSGKYEVAEFAAYAGLHTPQTKGISLDTPWKLYLNEPAHNSKEYQEYSSKMTNIYGKWRFDRVCLDFEPTHVLCLRDKWMDEHLYTS